MADVQSFILDLDNADFVAKLQDTLGQVKKLGDAENMKGLIESLETAVVIVGAVGTAFLIAKAALDLTETAEQVAQVNNEFDLLTKNSGIATETLKEGLEKSANGLISNTDLLQSANKAIIELGANANKLPQIMDIARKATAAFGGDLQQNFEGINQAIASGNTRMLKHMGIIVDANQAYKTYAQSIGVTVDVLSQAGKQTAVLNEVLDQGSTKFKGVNSDALQTGNSIKQFWTSLKELYEVIAQILSASDLFTGFFKGLAGYIDTLKSDLIVMTTGWGKSQELVNVQIKGTQAHIADLNHQLDQLNNDKWAKLFGGDKVEETKNKLKAQIADAEASITQLEAKKNAAAGGGTGAASGAGGAAANQVDLDKQLAQQATFNKELQALRDQNTKAAVANETTIAQVEQHHAQEILQVEQDKNQKLQAIEAKRREGKITGAQADALKEQQIELSNTDKLAKMNDNLYSRKIKALDNFSVRSKSSAAQFSAGWQQSSLQAQANLSNFATMGKKAFDSLNKNGKSAFIALGEGSQTAGQAMKGFILGSIADMAEAQGEFLLASGIGTFNPIQIAEGGALLALSGLLRGLAGGASSSMGGSSGGGDSSGGGGSTTTPSTDNGSTTPNQSQAYQKTVTVAFNGPYYETDQTKQRLTELIRENTDATAFQYNQIGV